MKQSHFPILVLLLLTPFQDSSGQEQIPMDDSVGTFQQMSWETRWTTPIEINSHSGTSLQSAQRASTLSYSTSLSPQRTLVVSVSSTVESLTGNDTLQHSLEVPTPSEFSASLEYAENHDKLSFAVGAEVNQSHSTWCYHADVHYGLPWIGVQAGISGLSDQFDIFLTEEEYHYNLIIQKDELQCYQEYYLARNSVTLSGMLTASLPSKSRESDLLPYGTKLLPHHQEFGVNLQVDLDESSSVEGYFNSSEDTCNAEIMMGDRSIGKITSLDLKHTQGGVRLLRKNLCLELSYHEVEGKIGGTVLTTPFGPLLSQLSGARFYLQGRANLQYVDLYSEWSTSPSQRLRLQLGTHAYLGSGELTGNSHIWQLFNPISSLAVGELTLNRYILLHPDLTVSTTLKNTWLMSLSWRRLIPIYLDYDLLPENATDFPAVSDSYESQLGSNLLLGITYLFK